MVTQRWVVCLLMVGSCAARPMMALPSTSAPTVVVPTADGETGPNDETSRFTVENQTQVPGKILKPGAYTIRIVDHLRDRMVVRIDRDGKQQTTFLALPVSGLQKPAEQGPIRLSGGKGKPALRGFAFSNGTLAEFVYPKEEAVGIAKANDTKIPAVDPASEGRSPNPALSSEDMKVVTLWMLSPTTVGPDGAGKGMAAERYQAPRQTASVPVATQSSHAQLPLLASVPAPREASRTLMPARAKPHPLMAALPHTSGTWPLVALTGLLAFGCAGTLARRRKSASC